MRRLLVAVLIKFNGRWVGVGTGAASTTVRDQIRSIGSQQHGQGQRLAGGSARALNLFLKGAALLPSAESCCPKEYSGSISPGSGWDSCDPHASRARKGN